MHGPLQPQPVRRASHRSFVRRVTRAGAHCGLAAPTAQESSAGVRVRYQSSRLPGIGDVLNLPVLVMALGPEPGKLRFDWDDRALAERVCKPCLMNKRGRL